MNMRERGKTHRTWKIKSRPENERQGIRHHSIVDQSFFIQTPELNPFRSSTLWIFIQSRMFAIFFLSISQSTRFDSFSHLKHFLCDIVVVVALLVSFLHLSNTRLRLLRFKFLFILTVLLRWPLAFHAICYVWLCHFSLYRQAHSFSVLVYDDDLDVLFHSVARRQAIPYKNQSDTELRLW